VRLGLYDDSTAAWKTLLVMPEGYGGAETFMLDVTNPFGTNALNTLPSKCNGTPGLAQRGHLQPSLGATRSLCLRSVNKTTSLNDYRLIFSSGYAVSDGSTPRDARWSRRRLSLKCDRDQQCVAGRHLHPGIRRR